MPQPSRPSRATRADVARLAGVSPASVSAALSGNRYSNVSISEPTRQRILAAARELDYRPNQIARSLKHQRSMLIGFLCRQVYRRSHEIMVGMQQTLEPRDYSIVHYSLGETLETELRHLELCWDRSVDGVLLTPMLSSGGRTNLAKVLELVGRGVPVVQLPNDPLPEVPSVTIDIRAGVRSVVEHLVGLGHRRIALLTTQCFEDEADPAQRSHPRETVNAYGHYLNEAGLEPIRITSEPGLARWGGVDRLVQHECGIVRRILEHPSRPTAVISISDNLAVGLLRGMARLGLCAPEALSVVGMHNERVGRLALPSLTTLEMHHDRIGCVAADMMLRQIQGESVESQQVRPTLVVRESTGPPGS